MATETTRGSDTEVYVLSEAPMCHGCGCEAEVVEYYREKSSKKRVGFRCTCGTVEIRGLVMA